MSFSDDSTTTTSPSRGPRSGGVLTAIESDSIKSCRQLLLHMFSATDDLFYELSKRATSNNEQNLYFESMREIRIKKEVLVERFTSGLRDNFSNVTAGKMNSAPNLNISEDKSLSILDSDSLEIDLASKNMANRTRESFKQETYELAIRLDHILLQTQVDEDNNPLDPQQISKAFVNACFESLEINIKAKLILFKLFEKHILKQLGGVYAEANRQLIEAGILPKVPKTFKKSEDSVDPRRAEAAQKNEHASLDDETNANSNAANSNADSTETSDGAAGEQFANQDKNKVLSITAGALSSLMEAVRRSTSNSGGVHYHIYCDNPGPKLQSVELTSGLTRKQPIIDKKISKSQPQNVLHTLISDILTKQNTREASALEKSDEEVINLVAMFFDKIIADKKLTVVAQSLICRLQIPVLKVALKDREFFSKPDHPARKLINIIAKASMQLDSSKSLERDPLYRTIVDGVQNINRQAKLNDSLFELVLSEIEVLLKNEARKAKVVEKRTEQTEIGKAKIKHAKAYAQSIVFDKIKDEQLPTPISDFITHTWLQVLVLTFIKEGKDSAHWVENEQLISDLLWLCKPLKDERSKIRAQRLKPEILSKIEKGLTAAVDNANVRSERIAKIEKTIDDVMRAVEKVEFKELSQTQKEALGRCPEGSNKAWGDMTALERQKVKFQELSSAFYLKAKNVPEGTWVEYKCDEHKTLHCKLSKKIESEIYIFVNRFGFKCLEKTRREFAYDMQSENAKLLDSTPLFDRIMDNIFSYFHVPLAH